jgi:multidrug efflux pump subunit AcrA (membrane-fusion protein)
MAAPPTLTGDDADVTEPLPLDDENILAAEQASRWRRYRWQIIAAAVVIVAAAIALPLWLTSGSPTAGGLTISTVTVSATTGTIQSTVTSSGTIEPATQSDLNFAVSGIVTNVAVKAGQTVMAGQVLATVDTTALTEQLNAAQAQLTSAQDRLSSDEGSGAGASQIDSDEASVTSAESSLSSAQTNLTDASLTSNIAGTVASVSLSVGQQVTGTGSGGGGNGGGSGLGGSSANGNGSTGGSGQIVVIGTDSYIVNTTVDDTQIGQISDGDQVDISLSGSGATTTAAGGAAAAGGRGGRSTTGSASSAIFGTVGSISLIGSQNSNVTTFPVVIDVTGNPAGLYAGASADVSIIVKQLNNVTEVPTNAISYTSSGQATVTEVINGRHVVTNVTVGAAENGETQIVSGVKAGDKLLEQQVTFKPPTGGGAGIFGGGGTPGRTFPGGAGGFGGGGFGGGGRFTGGGGFGGGG